MRKTVSSPSASTTPLSSSEGRTHTSGRKEKVKTTTLRVNETDFTVILHGFARSRCWVEVQTPEEFRGWKTDAYKRTSGQVAILCCRDELARRVKEKLLEDMIEAEFEKL